MLHQTGSDTLALSGAIHRHVIDTPSCARPIEGGNLDHPHNASILLGYVDGKEMLKAVGEKAEQLKGAVPATNAANLATDIDRSAAVFVLKGLFEQSFYASQIAPL
jgi:hypothetical protein